MVAGWPPGIVVLGVVTGLVTGIGELSGFVIGVGTPVPVFADGMVTIPDEGVYGGPAPVAGVVTGLVTGVLGNVVMGGFMKSC